jgi:hypothetical protein
MESEEKKTKSEIQKKKGSREKRDETQLRKYYYKETT